MKPEPAPARKTSIGPTSRAGSPSAPPSGIIIFICWSMRPAASGPRKSRSRSAPGCLHRRRQRVDGDIVGGPGLGGGSGPRLNRALRRGIDGRNRAAHNGFGGSEVDDPAALGVLVLHDGVGGLIGEDGRLDVGVQQERDLVGADVSRYAGLPQPRGVDQDVESAEVLGRLLHHRRDCVGVARIALQPGGRQVLRRRRLVIGGDDLGARLGENPNGGRADTGRCAGDQDPSALQGRRHI